MEDEVMVNKCFFVDFMCFKKGWYTKGFEVKESKSVFGVDVAAFVYNEFKFVE